MQIPKLPATNATRLRAAAAVLAAAALCPAGAARAQEPAPPEPGKQVLQRTELPALRPFPRPPGAAAGDQARLTAKHAFFNGPDALDPAKKESVAYSLFLPASYSSAGGERFPLLVFLDFKSTPHLEGQLADPGKRNALPFIIAAPHPGTDDWSPKRLLLFLDELEKRFAVDADRIYLTGVSRGGSGTWYTAMAAPERFAAVAPICGLPTLSEAARLTDLAVWASVGAQDSALIIDANKEMAAAIEAKGGRKIKLTIYPGVGHGPGPMYGDPEFYCWLLEQTKGKGDKP